MSGSEQLPATQVDYEQWSGEGEFTLTLIDWLVSRDAIGFIRVEDAASTRNDVEYNFISNEVFVRFRTVDRVAHTRLWGIFPRRRVVSEPTMTLDELDTVLTDDDAIASPDYADEGMIQFLHTQRIVPPYQTRGYKLVELVRLYEVGTPSRSDD